MQSTGQTSTHEPSLTPIHGCVITYVMRLSPTLSCARTPQCFVLAPASRQCRPEGCYNRQRSPAATFVTRPGAALPAQSRDICRTRIDCAGLWFLSSEADQRANARLDRRAERPRLSPSDDLWPRRFTRRGSWLAGGLHA